jgi:hyperosmotically inducible protein
MRRSALLALLCLYAAAGQAATNNARFLALDTNHDGYLSRDETSGIHGYAPAFAQADANHDGRLDPGEFLKAESLHDRMMAGNYIDDSVITAKVKAELLNGLGAKSLDVDVETERGRVLLSGFVDNDAQRRKIVQLASAVSGVTEVKDGLTLR